MEPPRIQPHLSSMGRRIRPQLPGMPFHITARIQGREPRFRGIEHSVASRILDAQCRSDAGLLAWAVMPNHLHLVLQQGREPLSQFMQPLLRRLAILVQKCTGAEGHIFERRFHASACLDADYIRNAIVYTHLNPVRAGLCRSPDEYPWSSHREYCALADHIALTDHRALTSQEIPIANALRVFASRTDADIGTCVADYRAFTDWRCAMDAYEAQLTDELPGEPPVCPSIGGGYEQFRDTASGDDGLREFERWWRPGLDVIARGVIQDLAPEMNLEVLRSGDHARMVVLVRRRFVLRAIAAGHRGGVIARFLQISPTTVSSIRTASRREGR